MRMKSGILIVLAVTLICSAAPVSAATISFEPSSLTIVASSSAQTTLWLSDAPDGLAGYIGTAVSSSPSATVAGAVFPSWATLNKTGAGATGYLLQGVDSGKQVQNGSTRIQLATLTVKGISEGTATVTLSGLEVDADGGGLISPAVGSLHVTVLGNGLPSDQPATGTTAVTTTVTTLPTVTGNVTSTRPQTTGPTLTALRSPTVTGTSAPSPDESPAVPHTSTPEKRPAKPTTAAVPAVVTAAEVISAMVLCLALAGPGRHR